MCDVAVPVFLTGEVVEAVLGVEFQEKGKHQIVDVAGLAQNFYRSHFSTSVIVFLFITVIGFVLHGAKFFGYFVPKGVPWPLLIILVPIELISYFSRPISLSVRLFANMMAGHAMMKVFASFCVLLGIFGIAPMVVNIALTGFEMLIACLQAYVFTVLTCLYINDAVHLH